MSDEVLDGGNVYITLPKSIPLGIAVAALIQISAVVWTASSFWKENQLFTEQVNNRLTPIEEYIDEWKTRGFTIEDGDRIEARLDRIGNRVDKLEDRVHIIEKNLK